MTNMHDTAPFSIAVALPTYRKSLVERLLQGLQSQAAGVAWQLVDTADADVVLRSAGDDPNDISPGLVAEVRRADRSIHTVRIDSPWRAGALLMAMRQIADALNVAPRFDPSAFDAIAWQWLRRWCELAATDARAIELRAGDVRVALLDPRTSAWRRYGEAAEGDATELLALLARDGYALDPTQAVPPMMGAAPLKPLLWRFGVRAGSQGPLPALAARGTLRLKGWPYLAAGGPKSYAELITQLRDGAHDHASLRALDIAPRATLYGFLNACHVCDFFHDDAAGNTLPPPVPKPPPRIVPPGAVPDRTGAVIASIRRSLGTPRS